MPSFSKGNAATTDGEPILKSDWKFSVYRPPKPLSVFGLESSEAPNLSLKDVRNKALEQCSDAITDLCHAMLFGDFRVVEESGNLYLELWLSPMIRLTLHLHPRQPAKRRPAPKHLTVARIQLLEIICQVIHELPDRRQRVLFATPWKSLVNWFFEHRFD
jgi:hypothetical protein